VELQEQYDVAKLIVDGAGPAKSLLTDMRNAYLDPHVLTAGEMVEACGSLYDAVENLKVRHFGEPALELAVPGAAKRELGDAWAWTRKKSEDDAGVDISPLVAVTMAHWGQVRFGDDGADEFPGSFR
jgi:hypothetical protein